MSTEQRNSRQILKKSFSDASNVNDYATRRLQCERLLALDRDARSARASLYSAYKIAFYQFGKHVHGGANFLIRKYVPALHLRTSHVTLFRN